MKIALGCDHGGYQLKEQVKEHLEKKGYEVLDLGCNSTDSVDYPVYGKAVGEAVVDQKAKFGIVICGTGIGISIAANKVKGVRAGLCMNTTMARLTREHNNANVLVLGSRVTKRKNALSIVNIFFKTKFLKGRHLRRVKKFKNV